MSRVCLCAVLLCAAAVAAMGQEETAVITNERALGDQSFAITVGLFVPLSTSLVNDWPERGFSKGDYAPNLNLGGVGSLSYSFYATGNVKVGVELSGAFANDINNNYVYPIPITVSAAWEFHIGRRFSLPLGLGFGVVMSSYMSFFAADFVLKPYTGFYFDWTNEWSFGLNVSYWFIPQLSSNVAGEHSLVHFLDVRLGVEYHF